MLTALISVLSVGQGPHGGFEIGVRSEDKRALLQALFEHSNSVSFGFGSGMPDGAPCSLTLERGPAGVKFTLDDNGVPGERRRLKRLGVQWRSARGQSVWVATVSEVKVEKLFSDGGFDEAEWAAVQACLQIEELPQLVEMALTDRRAGGVTSIFSGTSPGSRGTVFLLGDIGEDDRLTVQRVHTSSTPFHGAKARTYEPQMGTPTYTAVATGITTAQFIHDVEASRCTWFGLSFQGPPLGMPVYKRVTTVTSGRDHS